MLAVTEEVRPKDTTEVRMALELRTVIVRPLKQLKQEALANLRILSKAF